MKQSKLGVPVGLLCAAVYFLELLSGFVAVIILAGYILLLEENEWLRKNTVKALVLTMLFTLFASFVNLIPGVINFVNDVVAVFGGKFSITFLTKLATALVSAIYLTEKILFLILGTKAIHQGSVSIPYVDGLINKYMG